MAGITIRWRQGLVKAYKRVFKQESRRNHDFALEEEDECRLAQGSSAVQAITK